MTDKSERNAADGHFAGGDGVSSDRHSGMRVRLADPSDIPALLVLGRAMHAESRYGIYPFDEARAVAAARRALAEPGRHAVLVAERAGAMIGYCHVAASEFLFSAEMGSTLQLLYVLPDKRGSLAAVKLLHAARRWARLAGAREILFGASSGVAIARTDRMMRRLGFTVVGGNYMLSTEGVR